MNLMGIQGIAPGPATSKPHPKSREYPYLLKDIRLERANQVRSSDITYIPTVKGFMYLVAIINYYNRERPHQSLGYVPPTVKYLGIQPAAVSPMGDFNGEVALVSSGDSWGARLQGTALTRENQKQEKISHFKIY